MRITRTPPTPARPTRVPRSTVTRAVTTAAPATPASPTEARRLRIRADESARTEAIRMSDAEVVECPTEESLLTEIINRTPRDQRGLREGDYLHVSDLIGKCVRKIVLAQRHSTPVRPQRLSASDIFTFAQGDAIHDSVKAMATASSPARVWGKWRCKCGHLFHEEPCLQAETDPNDICTQCGTPTNVYEEVPMRDPDTMIVGTPDLILYLREVDAFHVSEIKSIKHEAWLELVRPKPEHVIQVLFYWYLMRKLGYRVTDRVSVFYVTKGYIFGATKPYKEFMFRPEEELHRLDKYLADAYAAKAARKDRKAELPKRICSGEYTVEAKQCEVCRICFHAE